MRIKGLNGLRRRLNLLSTGLSRMATENAYLRFWTYRTGAIEYYRLVTGLYGEEIMPVYSVSVPDTVQAISQGRIGGRFTETSWCFQRIGGHYTVPDLQTLADELHDYWRSYFRPHLSRDFELNQVFCIGLDPFGHAFAVSHRDPFVGAASEGAMPNNVGFRLDHNTGIAGQAYRGWNTMPGIPRSRVIGNQVTQAYADGVQGALSGILTLANGLGWNWVVASTVEAGVPRVVGLATPIISVTYKDLIVDSSRHRLPGRRF